MDRSPRAPTTQEQATPLTVSDTEAARVLDRATVEDDTGSLVKN